MNLVENFRLKTQHFIPLGLEYDAESKIKYDELIEKIEHFSKMCHLLLVKLTFTVIIIPPFIVTYVCYYILELGDESFLDVPVKYVTTHAVLLKFFEIYLPDLNFKFKIAIGFENATGIFVLIASGRRRNIFNCFSCSFDHMLFRWTMLVIHFICE